MYFILTLRNSLEFPKLLPTLTQISASTDNNNGMGRSKDERSS
ncbi:14822_t:CDS:2 [Entrophospora sp. SA101]|nr:14822_t:CDS:2 [Entrophospora sp. SA101]